MLDVVIPFKSTINNDEELRFTLRSFCKNFAGLGQAYVVGDKPKWEYNPEELVWIHFPDPYKKPHFKSRNIVNKVLRGLQEVKEVECLVADDDMVQLSACDANIIPTYHKGRTWRSGAPYDDYAVTESNTRNLLQTEGRKINNFNTHSPYIVLVPVFRKYMTTDIDWTVPHGYCIKAVYSVRAGVEGEFYNRDLNIKANLSLPDVSGLINGGDRYFTCEDNAFRYGVRQWLEERFPEKSKFEL
jgi:hypothetical protein